MALAGEATAVSSLVSALSQLLLNLRCKEMPVRLATQTELQPACNELTIPSLPRSSEPINLGRISSSCGRPTLSRLRHCEVVTFTLQQETTEGVAQYTPRAPVKKSSRLYLWFPPPLHVRPNWEVFRKVPVFFWSWPGSGLCIHAGSGQTLLCNRCNGRHRYAQFY